MDNNLNKFLEAQENDYDIALSEIKAGSKESHWMWYIFPQIRGLGCSETSKYYAINDIDEAKEYLNHAILGSRLKEISNVLLSIEQDDASLIFGYPDDIKLKSCMTLFAQIDECESNIFKKVIDKFFNGNFDNTTLLILEKIRILQES